MNTKGICSYEICSYEDRFAGTEGAGQFSGEGSLSLGGGVKKENT